MRTHSSIRPFAHAVLLPMPRSPSEKGAGVTALFEKAQVGSVPAPAPAQIPAHVPAQRAAAPTAHRSTRGAQAAHRRTGGTHRAVGPRHRARLYSLDGLRGVAAVVVFVHHVFLTQPALAEAYRDNPGPQGSMAWLLTHTPLHLLWAGTEAVFVFFVLSGLVLALPAAAGGRIDVVAYFPRRLVRLYLPVWAAVVLALGWAAAVPKDWDTGDSWWLPAHAGDPTASGVTGDLLLIHVPGSSNHVLWSLQWEVAYCLALPLVLVLLRVGRRLWWLKGAAVLATLSIGAGLDSPALWYLSIFALGTLMALERLRLAGWAAWLDDRALANRWWAATAGVAIVLLLSYWFVPVSSFDAAGLGVVRGLQAVGGCGVVFAAWFCPAARDALNSELAQWFGDRSFSLYLVHLPVVVAVTTYLGGQPHLGGVLILSALIAFPLSAVFYRYVEQPAHRLARRLGQMITNARSPEPRPRPIMGDGSRRSRRGGTSGAELVPVQRWRPDPAALADRRVAS